MTSETDLVSCDTKSTENLKPNDLKTEVECDHPEGGLIPNSKGELGVIEFAYCPKCGEKL